MNSKTCIIKNKSGAIKFEKNENFHDLFRTIEEGMGIKYV